MKIDENNDKPTIMRFLMNLFLLFPLLSACSDYSFDEGKTYVPEADDTAVEEEYIPTEEPDILVEPNPIEFGYLLKDCPSDPIDVTITNRGEGDLNITNLSIDGNGSSAFSSTYDGSEIILAQNESYTLGMYFLPTLYLDYEVELEIESNDPEPPEVPVTGVGSEGAVYEESFQQEFNSDVDVLWVFDNSCSMDDNIINVKSNFSSFLTSFLSLGLDYQMAIVTTDMVDNGMFQGPVMNSSQGQQAVINTFTSTLDQILNTNGSGNELGLEVTKAALSNQSSFMRNPSNGLSVILVTDEDDSGSNINGSNFINWFQGLKSNDITLARMSAFLDANGGLFGGNPIYEEVIQATQGYIADINSSSYQQSLEEMALAAAGLTVRFPLEEEPSTLSSITVTVNGTVTPQDPFNGWTYDSRSNSLVFHGTEIPEAGENVSVSYMVQSECN
jgi:hypothetical protein